MSQVKQMEQAEVEGATITTKAPKAEKGDPEKGKMPTKPEGWSMTLPDPTAGLSLEELIEKYGEEKIKELAVAQFVVKFQAAIRTMAENGRADEDIAQTMSTWKPGDKISEEKLTTEQKILKNFGNMTPEQRAELMAKLAAM